MDDEQKIIWTGPTGCPTCDSRGYRAKTDGAPPLPRTDQTNGEPS